MIFRALVVVAGTAFLLALTTFGSHGTMRVNADQKAGMRIKLYKWTKRAALYKSKGEATDRYAMIMWQDGNNTYFMSGGNVGDNNYHGTNINIDPYIEFTRDYNFENPPTFMTRGLCMVPKLIYKGEGNYKDYYGNYYDVEYKLKFSNGKYLYTTYWDHLKAEDDGDTWVLMNYDDQQFRGNRKTRQHGGNDDDILRSKSWWFMYDRSAAYDTHIANSGDKVYGRSSNGGWRCSDFWIWTAEEINMDAIGDYTIDNDQTLAINGDTFLLDGSTLKIAKDGVLCVRSNFYCNGTIDCEGTIIVEKGGNLMPYSPSGAGGNVIVRNGGTMVVMSGGKALLGVPSGKLNASEDGYFRISDSDLYNFGLIVSGNTLIGNNTNIENHDNATLYLGYSVSRNTSRFTRGGPANNASELGIATAGTYTNGMNVRFKTYAKSKYSVGRCGTSIRIPVTFVIVDKDSNEYTNVRNL